MQHHRSNGRLFACVRRVPGVQLRRLLQPVCREGEYMLCMFPYSLVYISLTLELIFPGALRYAADGGSLCTMQFHASMRNSWLLGNVQLRATFCIQMHMIQIFCGSGEGMQRRHYPMGHILSLSTKAVIQTDSNFFMDRRAGR